MVWSLCVDQDLGGKQPGDVTVPYIVPKNEPHYMINFKHKENVTEMLWFVSIRKTAGSM